MCYLRFTSVFLANETTSRTSVYIHNHPDNTWNNIFQMLWFVLSFHLLFYSDLHPHILLSSTQLSRIIRLILTCVFHDTLFVFSYVEAFVSDLRLCWYILWIITSLSPLFPVVLSAASYFILICSNTSTLSSFSPLIFPISLHLSPACFNYLEQFLQSIARVLSSHFLRLWMQMCWTWAVSEHVVLQQYFSCTGCWRERSEEGWHAPKRSAVFLWVVTLCGAGFVCFLWI